jgi:hypothetical protein
MRRTLAITLLAATVFTGTAGSAQAATCYVADHNYCETRDRIKDLVLEAVECGPILWDPCF